MNPNNLYSTFTLKIQFLHSDTHAWVFKKQINKLEELLLRKTLKIKCYGKNGTWAVSCPFLTCIIVLCIMKIYYYHFSYHQHLSESRRS